MPLELKKGGVITYVRHALIFYGESPTAKPDGEKGSGPLNVAPAHFKVDCRDQLQRSLYEKSLREELAAKFGINEVRLVHIHDAAEMRAATERERTHIWDVVGWVGHAALQGADLLPILEEPREGGRLLPGTVISWETLLPMLKSFSHPPREFLIVGCDASIPDGLGQRISAAFPKADVVAGVKTSKIVFTYPTKDGKLIPGIPFSRAEIRGSTVVFKNGQQRMDDKDVEVELQKALDQPEPVDVPKLVDAHIHVSFKKGVATLSGEIPIGGAVQKAAANRIVRTHPTVGKLVKHVVDHLHQGVGAVLVDKNSLL